MNAQGRLAFPYRSNFSFHYDDNPYHRIYSRFPLQNYLPNPYTAFTPCSNHNFMLKTNFILENIPEANAFPTTIPIPVKRFHLSQRSLRSPKRQKLQENTEVMKRSVKHITKHLRGNNESIKTCPSMPLLKNQDFPINVDIQHGENADTINLKAKCLKNQDGKLTVINF